MIIRQIDDIQTYDYRGTMGREEIIFKESFLVGVAYFRNKLCLGLRTTSQSKTNGSHHDIYFPQRRKGYLPILTTEPGKYYY